LRKSFCYMKKIYAALTLALATTGVSAQNPGLVISEFLANPNGNDLNLEWVELVATQSINFASTPYTVVVNNNGTATANGWIQGGNISYAFAITTGSVAAGDVVYVGGNGMAPTGVHIREINVTNTGGDGFGNAQATGGVVGNGGGNADGIAVFNMPVASITSATVPVDAIFYGTAIGSALVNSGADGYQLPVNDRYSGGKLQSGSYIAADPASDQTIRATGYFNTTTNQWFGQRTWTSQAINNNNLSNVQLVTADPPGTASIATSVQTVSEAAGTVSVNVTFANANNSVAKIAFGLSVYTNATQNSDFSWATDTLYIPANSNGTFPFTINLTDDALAERTERIIVKMVGAVNANVAPSNYQIIYLTDNDYVAPQPSNELQMQLLTSFSTGAEGTNSAEIVAFDPTTDRLYTANSIGGKIDIINFATPNAPSIISSISMAPYGGINSIAVHNGIVAAAVENANPQANGSVVFFDQNGAYLNQLTVGAMPDMITFNNDFTKILVACEGEPNTNYTPDPEGTVAIIDLSAPVASLTNANVTMVNFQSFNGQEATLRTQGIRIFGPGSTAAQDFEPEYITISEDNSTAYVSLQENNAMAVIDIATATVTELRPLGSMDYSMDNGLDASDQTAGVYISSVPVKGLFMPDAIAHATIGGTEYIFSANEGDAREFNAVTDVARVSATTLDPVAFPDQNILKNNQFLGRLNVVQMTGDTDNDGDKDELQTLGTRSFSIWNAATGALVFDSKDWLEQITASHPTLAGLFNASNTQGTAVAKNRSDDKGPEPEGVATAFINGSDYLFVSLERIGGVMIFNIDNPAAPVYSGYYNNRSVGANSGPDRGAEGIIHITAQDSPNGEEIVILANEVSSTLSIYQVNTCVALAGAEITASEDTICEGSITTLSITGGAGSSVQWLFNDMALTDSTGNSIMVTEAGDYRVYVSSTTYNCADTTMATAITVNELPVISAGMDVAVCEGEEVTLTASGAADYSWNNDVDNGVAFTPEETEDYIVSGTDANGCSNTDTVTVTVNTLPVVSAGMDIEACEGSQITLNATGAATYDWNNDVTNGQVFEAEAGMYIVEGTDANGCQDSDTVNVIVNELPVVSLGQDMTVCTYDFPVTLTASAGFNSYSWNTNATGQELSVTSAGTYTVTATDENGCQDSDAIVVTADACLGIEEQSIVLSVYPNPASGTITVSSSDESEMTLEIMTLAGQIVKTEKGSSADLSQIASGQYLLRITQSGMQQTVRIEKK
jgi:hypothetical protein